MKHTILLTCTLLAGCLTALAQTDSIEWQPQEPRPIKPRGLELAQGDAMPDYIFKNPLINYPVQQVSLSDFADRLVIMELWSRSCASCIAGFPKLQQLQEQFGESLQIILVNPWANKEELEQLMERRKQLFGFDLQLPVAYGDTDLYDMFTVDGSLGGVPHFVWIHGGEIISVTHRVYEEDIQAILCGEEVEMEQKLVKYPVLMKADQPLFVAGNAGNGEGILWHSVLSHRVPNLRTHARTNSNSGDVKRMGAINVTVDVLFRNAYSSRNPVSSHTWDFLPGSRLMFDMPDASKFVYMADGKHNWKNQYCYQLYASLNVDDERMYRYMQQDLERYFGVMAKWEKREVECLVITSNNHNLLMSKSTDKMREGVYWTNIYLDAMRIENATMAEFVNWLEKQTFFGMYTWPIIDETGFEGVITNLELVGILDHNWESWNYELEKYGLRFLVEKRTADILVIKEVD